MLDKSARIRPCIFFFHRTWFGGGYRVATLHLQGSYPTPQVVKANNKIEISSYDITYIYY